MGPKALVIKGLRRVFREPYQSEYPGYVSVRDQAANDMIRKELASGKPFMVSKFGVIELSAVLSVLLGDSWRPSVLWDAVRGRIQLFPADTLRSMCTNAGFFPEDAALLEAYAERVLSDIREIDVLGSYQYAEKYLSDRMDCVRVNLDGYYAPFLWEHPWTGVLEGKRVLVVHPFASSIRAQYGRRKELFKDPEVLPEFSEFTVYPAVQSVSGNRVPFKDWFGALAKMETDIAAMDFDIALVGCGAYGMSLSAFIKRMGRQVVHLAGWTQMLFGIYGERWLAAGSRYARFINDAWIRPSAEETPVRAREIENGCYW